MKKIALLWLVCGFAPLLCAQQETRPELPPGPWLNKAPEFAQWTITSKIAASPEDPKSTDATPTPSPSASPTTRRRSKPKEPSDKPPVPPPEQKTVVTKTQSIRHEETSTGTEAKVEKWCVPDMQITMAGSASPVVSLPGGSADSDYTDYSQADFPGFGWMTDHNFIGTKQVMGQECWVFQGETLPKKRGAAPSAQPLSVTACINTATRLPVTLQVEDETQTYEFGLAPTALLTLPPAAAELIEQWRKTMKQSALAPSKP